MEAVNDLITTVVFKIRELCQCQNCTSELTRFAGRLRGVETATLDIDSSKLTVVGEVDPLQIQEQLCRKIKKKVQLVSPQPKKDDTTIAQYSKNEKASGEKMLDFFNEASPQPKNIENATTSNQDDKKFNAKKPSEADTKALVTTIAVLKLGHYCHGCGSRIREIVKDTDGVEDMTMDKQKETVIVKGTMDARLLMENLKQRLRRRIDIVSLTNEDYGNKNGKDSENVSGEKGSSQEDGSKSIMELKPHEGPVTMAVFKMPLPSDGNIGKIHNIISKIIGVHGVGINKKEETVTVTGTIDVNSLFENMKRRLKKFVEEQNIEIKATSQYIFDKKYPKQEISSQPALQISEQPSEIHMISVHDQLSDESSVQNQSPVNSSGYAQTELDSEIGERSYMSKTTAWAFLIASLVLEIVTAALEYWGHLLVGMVLAYVSLSICTIELFGMAQHEELIAFDGSSDLPCFYCSWTIKSQTSEHFSIVHSFGLTCALWQCLQSTMQYICVLRHSNNPITINLLPFLFLLCVLFSKLVRLRRKQEERNCQNMNNAKDRTESPLYLSSRFNSGDQGYGSRRSIQHNGHTLENMETKAQVQAASEPADATASLSGFAYGVSGCSHYRRTCKIRAPCCDEIFFCENCHNEAKNSVETKPQDRHVILSHAITKVICTLCGTEQDVQQSCVCCGVCMGKYFCSKCKFFDDDVSKKHYHCDECGICRNGGRDSFFHCKACGYCYPISPEDAHHCVEKEIGQD